MFCTHRKTGTPEYKIWGSMLQRCNNPNDRAYKNYGGRGITVCKRWDKFENFLKDMGDRPEGKTSKGYTLYSLERIDNNKGYTSKNCKWATWVEQINNQRNNRKKGETHHFAKLSDIKVRIIRRLNRRLNTELANIFGVSNKHIGALKKYQYRATI